jgi:outer membrane protein assembly factor BamB
MRRIAIVALITSFPVTLSADDNWPGFRGPTGMGQSDAKNLPTSWGGRNGDNVLWKVPLPHKTAGAKPDHNQSSPIVWGERVFVSTSFWPQGTMQKEFPEHHVTCFAAKDGKQLWDVKIEPGSWLLTDLRGGYTAPTPATDGQRVYALFGSGTIAALDVEGNILWRKDIPSPQLFDVAIGTSPILYQGTVLILCDKVQKGSHLLALDAKNGETKWDVKRPSVQFDHTTPVLAKVNGKDQLLIGAGGELQGVAPSDGQVLWFAKNDGDVPRPVLSEGLVYCDSGRGGGVGIAVDPTGSGDVTKTHVRWKTDKKIASLGSPIVSGEYLYRLRDPGLLTCYKVATGEVVFEERVQGIPTTPSPFATADGRIFFASAGRSLVIRAGATYEPLGNSDLGEDDGSSAAAAGGSIFFKGRDHLFCIGKR